MVNESEKLIFSTVQPLFIRVLFILAVINSRRHVLFETCWPNAKTKCLLFLELQRSDYQTSKLAYTFLLKQKKREFSIRSRNQPFNSYFFSTGSPPQEIHCTSIVNRTSLYHLRRGEYCTSQVKYFNIFPLRPTYYDPLTDVVWVDFQFIKIIQYCLVLGVCSAKLCQSPHQTLNCTRKNKP